MKKTVIYAISILILAIIVIFVFWGFLEAREIKAQTQQIKEITFPTLNLRSIKANEFEMPIGDWKNNAEEFEIIKADLDKFDKTPPSLKENLEKFYSSEAQKRLNEIEFLQFLIDSQRKIDVQDRPNQKSKGQIETVLSDTQKFVNDFSKYKLNFVGSDFEPYIINLEKEEKNYENYLKSLGEKMTYESGKVAVKSDSLNSALEELETKLTESLNNWVSLQKKIKEGISEMGKNIWINPLRGL